MQANQTITQDAGNDGVTWVQGKTFSDGSLHAAGKNQPPIHVVADTVESGLQHVIESRALTVISLHPANSDLANQFPTPADAVTWITGVLGDQISRPVKIRVVKPDKARSQVGVITLDDHLHHTK